MVLGRTEDCGEGEPQVAAAEVSEGGAVGDPGSDAILE